MNGLEKASVAMKKNRLLYLSGALGLGLIAGLVVLSRENAPVASP